MQLLPYLFGDYTEEDLDDSGGTGILPLTQEKPLWPISPSLEIKGSVDAQ